LLLFINARRIILQGRKINTSRRHQQDWFFIATTLWRLEGEKIQDRHGTTTRVPTKPATEPKPNERHCPEQQQDAVFFSLAPQEPTAT